MREEAARSRIAVGSVLAVIAAPIAAQAAGRTIAAWVGESYAAAAVTLAALAIAASAGAWALARGRPAARVGAAPRGGGAARPPHRMPPRDDRLPLRREVPRAAAPQARPAVQLLVRPWAARRRPARSRMHRLSSVCPAGKLTAVPAVPDPGAPERGRAEFYAPGARVASPRPMPK